MAVAEQALASRTLAGTMAPSSQLPAQDLHHAAHPLDTLRHELLLVLVLAGMLHFLSSTRRGLDGPPL